MEIKETKNYELFKFLKGNRPTNPMHVKRLERSIKINGMLCSPIIVNEKYEIIDGQHRLLAAKNTGSQIYYIVVNNYKLEEVHTLNQYQRNFSKADFMNGYADMGVQSYINLRDFSKRHDYFNLTLCSVICANRLSHNERNKTGIDSKEIFVEGTYITRDMELAETNANKLKSVESFYDGYYKQSFAVAFLGVLTNDSFDYEQFINKLRIQPRILQDCANVSQSREMIEEVYNYKRRIKINLRFS